jgi:YtkA-like
MRTTAVLMGVVGVFLALVVVAFVASAGSKTTPVVASQAVSAPAATGQSLTPQGTVLGKGSQQIGDLTVWLSAPKAAPVRGQNVIEALIVNASGQAVNDARVSFDLDMTNMSHGKNVLEALRVGDGRYDGNVSFMMPGPWRIIAAVERGGKAVGSARFDFTVNLR